METKDIEYIKKYEIFEYYLSSGFADESMPYLLYSLNITNDGITKEDVKRILNEIKEIFDGKTDGDKELVEIVQSYKKK